jgi:hypothetical protein
MNTIGRIPTVVVVIAIFGSLVIDSKSFGVDSTWTAGGGDGKWTTPTNWNNGVPKNTGDKATINISNTNVTLDDTQSLIPVLDQFTVDGTSSTFVRMQDVTFKVNGPAELKAGRVLLKNVTWEGTGTLTNTISSSIGALTIYGQVNVKSNFNQKGRLEIVGSVGGQNPTNLTVPTDFNNSGHIRMSQTTLGGNKETSLSVGVGSGQLTNSGRIEFDNTGGLCSIFTKYLTNSGIITVANNNKVSIGYFFQDAGDFINSNSVVIGKKATLEYGPDFYNKTGGSIEGSGTLKPLNDARFFPDGGSVAPGIKNLPASNSSFAAAHEIVDLDELGILTFDGGYAQDPLGTLQIQIGGTAIDTITGDTEFDRLAVINGPALLDGTLKVSLANNFVPGAADTFDILVGDGSLVGSFANAQGSSLSTLNTPDGTWTVEYLRNVGSPSVVRLSNFVAVAEPATIGLQSTAAFLVLLRRCKSRR